jgi:hypothetical protein
MEESRLTTVLNVNEVHRRRLKRRPNGSHQKPAGFFGREETGRLFMTRLEAEKDSQGFLVLH